MRSSGVKTVIYHWARALQKQLRPDDSLGLFPFLNSAALSALDHERSPLGKLSTFARLGLLHVSDITSLPVLDYCTQGADVFHVTQPIYSPPGGVPLTATIHDMTCWLMPQLHTQANARATRRFGEVLWPKAARLIAVSECSKLDAVRILHLHPDSIEVIYNGVAAAFHVTPETTDQAVAARLKLPAKYLLYLGTIEPRKNVAELIRAFDSMPKDVREEFPLLLAGPEGWNSQDTVRQLRERKDQVRYLGYIQESDLPCLTRRATAFVYPSLYEGFGLPVAQAMACGVPVITSNVSSLPEITGDAACLVDPHSQSELRSGIMRVLGNAQLREELARKGLHRAANYTWEANAQRSIDFFHRAHA